MGDSAAPDEPAFVLRASDPAAPALVRLWAQRTLLDVETGRRPKDDIDKVRGAFETATRMERWCVRRGGNTIG